MLRLMLHSGEAVHLANLLCRQGFFFAVECNNPIVIVKDDSTLYRFQVRPDHLVVYIECKAFPIRKYTSLI